MLQAVQSANKTLNNVRGSRGRRSRKKFSLAIDPTRTTLTLMRSEVGIRIGDREKESESGGNRIADIRNAFFPSADSDDSAVGSRPEFVSVCKGKRKDHK